MPKHVIVIADERVVLYRDSGSLELLRYACVRERSTLSWNYKINMVRIVPQNDLIMALKYPTHGQILLAKGRL